MQRTLKKELKVLEIVERETIENQLFALVLDSASSLFRTEKTRFRCVFCWRISWTLGRVSMFLCGSKILPGMFIVAVVKAL